MGMHENITSSKFPKQGEWLGKRTKVCFYYEMRDYVMGTIVRDDIESPFQTVISLDDGRIVLGTECMHSPQ